ncbi:hypothetical protein ACTRXD_00830 [Nitrospira sp. T9]|uniref:hypothetical protein n=1 Tax=unclassified Nitrospira TaxID=2652172 RepID=UPI003F9C129C
MGLWEGQINTKEVIGGSISAGLGSEGGCPKKLMGVGILRGLKRATLDAITGRTMRSIRMVIAAIFPGIPFPHSLDDWIICMTSLGPWFFR